MSSLAEQHCLNHSMREAVARCPECRHFFCRECIVEHDERVLCGACLRRLSAPRKTLWRPWRALNDALLCVAGLLTAFLFFYWAGQLLLMIPTTYHDGTVWQPFQGSE
jgi:hypothetical protein